MPCKNLFLSSGDPAGIGTEIIIKFVSGIAKDPLLKEIREKILAGKISITILGNKEVYLWHKAKSLDPFFFSNDTLISSGGKKPNSRFLQFRFKFIDVPLSNFTPDLLGNVNETMGENCLQLLNACVASMKKNIVHALVTAPINKKAISLVDKNFVGHTDFLAEKFTLTNKVSMTFFSPLFSLVLTTIHIPLKKVAEEINETNLKRTLSHALEIRELFKTKSPVLVLGLNPHAGEDGLLGREESVIKKVMNSFANPKDFLGPVSADTAFIKAKSPSFPHKVIVAHYHDQGLIPLKTLAFNKIANVTWGLPFVRTSVDHGTAYDLVGKNQASPLSLYFAIHQAIRLLESRNND